MPNKDNNFSPEKLKRASKIASKKNTAPKLLDSIEEGVLRAFRWLSVVIDKFLFSSKNTVLLATIIAVTLYVSVYASKTNISSALSSSKTISNVTISARYNSESFELSGLPTSCSVVITGDAANVNNASTRNGYCLLNLEGYTEGTHTIKITAANYGDSVNTVVTPSEAQITLKRKTTAQYDISYDFINQNQLDSRFILSAPVFDTGTKVNIRASQDTLNSISMVKALIDVKDMTDRSDGNQFEAGLIAYDSKGQQVNAEIVPSTITGKEFISKPSKEVPIVLKVQGAAPVGLALDTVTMDHQTTIIYAPQSELDKINQVEVTFDISTITTDANIMLPISLPSGISSSEVTMVNVSATLAIETSKEIENVPIVYRNNENNLGASDVDFTTVTVTVFGSENNIEEIDASHVIAYINLKDENGELLQPGQYELKINTEKNTNAYVSFQCDPQIINITLVGQE